MNRFRVFFACLVVVTALLTSINVPINLGLDLQGGMHLILEAKDTEKVTVDKDAISGVMEVIRNRIDGLGLTEPIIRKKGLKQIIVELPGIKDPQRAINLIGETALLEFVEAEWAPNGIEKLSKEKLTILAGENARVDKIIQRDQTGHVVSETSIILKSTVMSGKDLKLATPGTSQYGEPVVSIEFTSEGAKKFYNVTSRNIGKPLAILLDGEPISAPNIQEAIGGGKAQISGNFSITEMKDLVIKLKAGALPVPIEIVSNKIVGPTLGKDSIEKSKKACLIGIIAVCLYMIVAYGLPGIMASIALICYLLISLGVLKLCHATLTLPGIAGLILTIGMAVDANVIIFERIKEEKKQGLNITQAINSGFKQAFSTILDANITTLIAAFVLFWIGTGSIKGFAITLSIGIVVSMYSAIVITKLLLEGLSKIALKKENGVFRI